MKPLFSIVIPVYNRQDTIGQLLNSIFACRLPFLIEIIIINSGSTDGTLEIINHYKDPRIRILTIAKSEFNHGLTRSLGVQKSRGTYVFFFSGDARIISKNIFTKTVTTFEKNSDCVLTFVRQIPYESTPFIQQLEATVYFDDLDKFVDSNGQVKQIFSKPFTPFMGTNKMLWYFNSDVAACYRRDHLVKYPFPKTEHGGEDVFAAKQALEMGFSKIYDSKLVVQHSHSYSFWEYIKRETVEVGLVTQLLCVPKKTRFVSKLNRIIHNKNQSMLMKVAFCVELTVLYSAKLLIFLTTKLNGRGLFISVVTAQIGLIILLGAYILTTRSANVNVAPLHKKNYIKTAGELKYFYEPANVTFDEPLPWNPDIKVKYTMNKDTIRANKEYAIPKPPDTLRIVAIGDSFTFGQFVKDDETYPAQLEVLLKEKLKGKYKEVEVINLGVPGYDIEYSIARYERRGKKYEADFIILLLTDDDLLQFNETELALISKLKREMTQPTITAYSKSRIFFPAHEIARKELRTSEFAERTKIRNIVMLNNFTKNLGKKLIFVTISNSKSPLHKALKEIVSINNSSIFLASTFPSTVEYYLPDSHLTKNGYKIISADLTSKISLYIK